MSPRSQKSPIDNRQDPLKPKFKGNKNVGTGMVGTESTGTHQLSHLICPVEEAIVSVQGEATGSSQVTRNKNSAHEKKTL